MLSSFKINKMNMASGDYYICNVCGKCSTSIICFHCDSKNTMSETYNFLGKLKTMKSNKNNETLDDVYHQCIEPKEVKKSKYLTTDDLDDLHYSNVDNVEKSYDKLYDSKLSDIFDDFFDEKTKSPVSVTPIKRKTLVVNLFAGPGSGKSTTAAGVSA